MPSQWSPNHRSPCAHRTLPKPMPVLLWNVSPPHSTLLRGSGLLRSHKEKQFMGHENQEGTGA